MTKIKLTTGRWIVEGQPFRFMEGESVAEDQNGNSIITTDGSDNFNDIITDQGILVGNVIKKVTSALGIKQCLKCKGRQRRYNEKGLELQQKVRAWFN